MGFAKKLGKVLDRNRAGIGISLIVLALAGGRWFWVSAQRPAHRQEIAAAFGSVALFYGAPQANHAGSRITFIETSDQGYGLFLCDTATGRKQIIHEENDLGNAGDSFDFSAWPWSPDDHSFIYSTAKHITICEPETGKATADLMISANVRDLVWLTSGAFVCLDKNGSLYRFRKQPDGSWNELRMPHRLPNAFSLTSLADDTIAWAQSNCIWTLNLASNTPGLFLNPQTDMPKGTFLFGFSYSQATGQFLLDCSGKTGDSLWQMDRTSSSPIPILNDTHAFVRNAAWLDGNSASYVYVTRKYLQNNFLAVQGRTPAGSIKLFGRGIINTFSVAPDGKQIFGIGVVSNEPSAEIWQYDLTASQTHCVVPCTNYPSPYAERMDPVHGTVASPAGGKINYTLYPPVNFNRHKKYPLVIGDTVFGVAVNGAHGRLWVPAIATCGAFVAIVDRKNWWDGIEQWGTNVMSVYQKLLQNPYLDPQQVFLFGASAETQYMSEFLTRSPALWKGVILLNPTELPDFSHSSIFQQKPKILISAGGEEHEDDRLKKYQKDALKSGVMVEYVIHPGEGHHLVGNAAQLERTKAMMDFIFEE